MVPDDNGSHGGKVLEIERGDHFLPLLLARLSIEAEQEIVGGFKVDIVMPDTDATVTNVIAALRLPKEMPDLVTIAGVEGPNIVGNCEVENTVYLENGASDIRLSAELHSAVSTHDRLWRLRVACLSFDDTRGPRKREILHVGLVD